jgi:hypothetical protein
MWSQRRERPLSPSAGQQSLGAIWGVLCSRDKRWAPGQDVASVRASPLNPERTERVERASVGFRVKGNQSFLGGLQM